MLEEAVDGFGLRAVTEEGHERVGRSERLGELLNGHEKKNMRHLSIKTQRVLAL